MCWDKSHLTRTKVALRDLPEMVEISFFFIFYLCCSWAGSWLARRLVMASRHLEYHYRAIFGYWVRNILNLGWILTKRGEKLTKMVVI